MKSCTPRGITSSKEKVSNSDIFFFTCSRQQQHTQKREREKDSERTQEIREKKISCRFCCVTLLDWCIIISP